MCWKDLRIRLTKIVEVIIRVVRGPAGLGTYDQSSTIGHFQMIAAPHRVAKPVLHTVQPRLLVIPIYQTPVKRGLLPKPHSFEAMDSMSQTRGARKDSPPEGRYPPGAEEPSVIGHFFSQKVCSSGHTGRYCSRARVPASHHWSNPSQT